MSRIACIAALVATAAFTPIVEACDCPAPTDFTQSVRDEVQRAAAIFRGTALIGRTVDVGAVDWQTIDRLPGEHQLK